MQLRFWRMKGVMAAAVLVSFFLTAVPVLRAAEDDHSEDMVEEKPKTEVPAPETKPAPPLFESDRKNEAKKDYRLQPGDRINIKIYPEDQYIKGGELQVSPEGNITMPLLGKVAVAGMSMAEAVQMLERIIDKDYLADPEVAIEILESKQKSFVILGQIKKPGTYQFPAGSASISLLEAISTAGGFSDIANIKKVKVLRREGNAKRTIQANAEAIISGSESDIQIQEGDVVNVAESLF